MEFILKFILEFILICLFIVLLVSAFMIFRICYCSKITTNLIDSIYYYNRRQIIMGSFKDEENLI